MGGYILWREMGPVMMDGRLEMYPKEFFLKSYGAHQSRDSFSSLADDLGFNTIIFSHYAVHEKIISWLFDDPLWRLVYFDGMAAIFVRNTPANSDVINKATEMFFTHPELSRDVPDIDDPKIAGYDLMVKFQLHSQRADFLKAIDNKSGAAAEYARAKLYAPSTSYYLQASRAEGRLLALSGNLSGAEGAFRGALAVIAKETRWPWNASELIENESSIRGGLGKMLAEQRRIDEAFQQFKLALKLSPDSAEAQNNMGSLLGATGRIPEAIPYFKRAIELEPDNQLYRGNLERASQ